MVEQHASAAQDVASVSEPLSLEAQQMYQSLADADVTASTGYLYGRIQPFPGRQRYEHDIAVATADLKAVTAASRDDPAVSRSLTTLSADLPVYTGYVEDGEIYNSLGYPAGASFIQVASEEMHLKLLPAARAVYALQNARLTAASAQATGLPLAAVTLVGRPGPRLLPLPDPAVAVPAYPPHVQRRAAGGLGGGLVALAWMAVALLGGRADLLRATEHGSGRPRRWPRPTSPRCRPGATRP